MNPLEIFAGERQVGACRSRIVRMPGERQLLIGSSLIVEDIVFGHRAPQPLFACTHLRAARLLIKRREKARGCLRSADPLPIRRRDLPIVNESVPLRPERPKGFR